MYGLKLPKPLKDSPISRTWSSRVSIHKNGRLCCYNKHGMHLSNFFYLLNHCFWHSLRKKVFPDQFLKLQVKPRMYLKRCYMMGWWQVISRDRWIINIRTCPAGYKIATILKTLPSQIEEAPVHYISSLWSNYSNFNT